MHIKVMGQGPDLVMLHGWSMHSAVWHDLAEGLAKHYTLHLVDLPGHGQSEWQPGALELDVLVNNLANKLPETAYWLGWSLGGLISIAFAGRFPDRVKKLILLSATPCFVQVDDWSYAMDASVFKAFSDNLEDDQAATLQRFLLLQARGSDHSRDTIRTLTAQLTIEKPPVPAALQAGLKLLIETDLRIQFSTLSCPLKMILGDRDTLIPKSMLDKARQLNPKLATTVLAGAGHAPFISQPTQCQHEIEQFINE
ncbi:MAG: pimeloyl-[acyl-carrier protein] methyl ester esterase [Methylophaga sp.]|nr:MAG: pimeloyl-[acyl-carrier protein] methyl ester esterase [Methylophaga sp.]